MFERKFRNLNVDKIQKHEKLGTSSGLNVSYAMNKKPPSIKFIAEMSKCSSASVSNVINGKGSVGDKTRGVILKNLRKYKYKINPSARSLRVRKSETVAVVFRPEISIFSSEFYLNVIRGFYRGISEFGYDVLLSECDLANCDGKSIPKFILNGKADAVAVLNSPINGGFKKVLKDFEVPSVVLDASVPGFDSVESDAFNAMFEVVSYLRRIGHRDIAYFGFEYDGINARTRLNAFLEAAKANRIFERVKLCEIFLSEYEAFSKFDRVFARRNAPTAIVVCNDVYGVALVRHARETGFRVPDDISVFGYGDISLAERSSPSLSTVHVDAVRLGEMGAETILERINNPELRPRSRKISCGLVIRESVKPV